jgi:hypothetical protein
MLLHIALHRKKIYVIIHIRLKLNPSFPHMTLYNGVKFNVSYCTIDNMYALVTVVKLSGLITSGHSEFKLNHKELTRKVISSKNTRVYV